MSPNIPFIFSSAPSSFPELDVPMPCYECSMLGYGMTCRDCNRFTATTSVTPPSSPTSDFVFSFNFPPPVATKLAAIEVASTPDHFNPATVRSRWNWHNLESASLVEPSSKTSRFNWSEMNLSTAQYAFDSCITDSDDEKSYVSSLVEPSSKTSRFNWSEMNLSTAQYAFVTDSDDEKSYVSDAESEHYANCAVCSMVPYGAICTSCDQIQASKAIILATPPAAAWPVFDRMGDWEGTKAPEEELLRNLDMELFEQINVPHELDEWGRRVYNDCGHRILYYQDSDGNTIMGYEAWYPSSVMGDYEEPDDLLSGGPIDASTVEPRRFTEFLAAQDKELPQFQSDRERIAAWIATSS